MDSRLFTDSLIHGAVEYFIITKLSRSKVLKYVKNNGCNKRDTILQSSVKLIICSGSYWLFWRTDFTCCYIYRLGPQVAELSQYGILIRHELKRPPTKNDLIYTCFQNSTEFITILAQDENYLKLKSLKSHLA